MWHLCEPRISQWNIHRQGHRFCQIYLYMGKKSLDGYYAKKCNFLKVFEPKYTNLEQAKSKVESAMHYFVGSHYVVTK